MFRPQAQAETHKDPAGPPLASSSYFFLFLYRLHAQAHSGPGSMLQGARKDLFFLFMFRLQAQARAVAQQQRTR